jgi:hypothetical protein
MNRNNNNNHNNRARNPHMQNVLALQALAVEANNFFEGEQSQATAGPACSNGSIQCVPPGACEAAFNLI